MITLRPPRSGTEERLELILEEQRAIHALLQELLDAGRQPTGNEIKVDGPAGTSEAVAKQLKRGQRGRGAA